MTKETSLETSLTDLNDDCIHKILSAEGLSAMDLCSVAETSSRLKEIAGGVFGQKYKTCDVNSLVNGAKSANRLIINFGPEMSDLRISAYEFEAKWTSRIVSSVAECCSNGLEALYLGGFDIPDDSFAAKSRPTFHKLRLLNIAYCTFIGAASEQYFADCPSLVELHIQDSAFIVGNTFPQLRQLVCIRADFNLDSFISRHTNLTTINILSYYDLSSLLPFIADNCKRLEQLRCFCDYQNVTKSVRSWTELKCLKKLELDEVRLDAQFMRTLPQLEKLQELALKVYCGLENLHQIGDSLQLTKLKVLSHEVAHLDVVLLIERLRNLKVLSVAVSGFRMDSETFSRIVDVVRLRPDQSKLIFELHFYNRCQYDDMVHHFARNRHIVQMDTRYVFD